MTSPYRSSRPDRWTSPRQPLADWQRQHHHGKIEPMETQPGLFKRIFGGR